ncbi:MAG: FAD-binding oxidoreductase [Acidobacteria bacterium]|nr:FAD-binding oxidoreductase [Acidobacteriota bacterium]
MRADALRVGQPVWLPPSSGRRDPIYPVLRGEVATDVVVVGGGFTGSAVAALFAEAGVRVCVVEAAAVGRGSTAASTALLLQEPDLGLLDLERRYGPTASRRIWQLSHEAARGLVTALRRLRVDCNLAARPSIYYTTSGRAVEALCAEHRHRCAVGLGGT